jgi:ABC-type bacteriocin/lantibiotic exporter with double-glycine peptidase domain
VFYLSFLVTTYCLLSGVAEGWIAAPMMVIFISAFTSVRSYLERLSELVKQCMELGAFLGNAQDILPKGSALPARLKSADWKEIRADKLYFSYHANTQGISVPSSPSIAERSSPSQGNQVRASRRFCFSWRDSCFPQRDA